MNDRVVQDSATVTEAEMADTTTVTRREVTANEVLTDRVLIGSGRERYAAACTTQTAVLRHGIVMDVQASVELVGRLVFSGLTLWSWQLKERLTNANTAMVGTVIAVHVIIRNLEIVCVAINQNTATDVASRNPETVNARVVT